MKKITAGALGLMLGAGMVGEPARAAESTSVSGEPAVLVPKERPTRKVFYGWEILAVAEPGSLVAAASVLLPDKPLDSFVSTAGFVVGMPFYALGGPIVHWQHGDFHRGLIAFGGNVVFPVVAGFAGRSIRCNEANAPIDCSARGFFSGFAIGALAAPIVDAIALGWEDVPLEDVVMDREKDPHATTGRRPAERFSILPTWSFGPRGSVELGVTGSF